LEQHGMSREIERPLTPRLAADVLNIDEKRLAKLRTMGAGPPFLKLGGGRNGRVAYLPSDLRTWLESRRFTSTSDYGAGKGTAR